MLTHLDLTTVYPRDNKFVQLQTGNHKGKQQKKTDKTNDVDGMRWEEEKKLALSWVQGILAKKKRVLKVKNASQSKKYSDNCLYDIRTDPTNCKNSNSDR